MSDPHKPYIWMKGLELIAFRAIAKKIDFKTEILKSMLKLNFSRSLSRLRLLKNGNRFSQLYVLDSSV